MKLNLFNVRCPINEIATYVLLNKNVTGKALQINLHWPHGLLTEILGLIIPLTVCCSSRTEVHDDPFTFTAMNEPNFSSSLPLSQNVQNYGSDTIMISVTCRTPFQMFYVVKLQFSQLFEKNMFLTATILIFIFLTKVPPSKKQHL